MAKEGGANQNVCMQSNKEHQQRGKAKMNRKQIWRCLVLAQHIEFFPALDNAWVEWRHGTTCIYTRPWYLMIHTTQHNTTQHDTPRQPERCLR
jgi:hypothetical protein